MSVLTGPPHPLLLEPIVRRALEEDLGRAGDVTSELAVPAGRLARARLLTREPGRIAGLICAAAAFRLLDPSLEFRFEVQDGGDAEARATLAMVQGAARSILTGERVALNFVGRLSGVATQTRALALFFGVAPDDMEAKRIAEKFWIENKDNPTAGKAAAMIREIAPEYTSARKREGTR